MRIVTKGQNNNTKIVTKNIFVLYVVGSFLLLTILLVSIDFVPELRTNATEQHASTSSEVASTPVVDTTPAVPESTSPIRIAVESIGLDTTIVTPQSTDIAVLDRALLTGAVHYPGSGYLGENANMLLFGHSSYLPVIQNQAFKAFNELNKLAKGDKITLYSDTHVYTYAVETVALSDAENVRVEFDSATPKLTLSTCNSFGSKQERWIVTATFISKQQL